MKEQFKIRKEKERFVKKIEEYGKPRLVFSDNDEDVLEI